MAPTIPVNSKKPISMAASAFPRFLNAIREFNQPEIIPCPQIVGFAVALFSHVVIVLGYFPQDLTGRQQFSGPASFRHARA
jgi:hypothetical protein